MKDEIKLKDMTDFLENVYKDIKKQPTLEEEQKQEKEFINKIKGNNANEIKELIDKAKEISDYGADGKQHTRMFNQFEAKALLDYITNLQEENNELKQIIDIRECQLEEMQMNKTDYTQVNILEMQLEDYKTRNKKAVEYIEHSQNYGTMAQVMPHLKPYVNGDDLLNILRVDDNE